MFGAGIPWADLSAPVAAIAGVVTVVVTFLRFLTRQDERHENFLGNHMSENRRAVEAGARAMERVADRLERIEDAVKKP